MEANTGRKIKELRLKNSYSQEEIAKVLDVKREMISYYENDERSITTTLLKKLLDFYGLTKKEIFEEENIEAQIKVAYRKEYLNIEDFKEVAWLNKFVSNLNELRAMNK